MDGEPAKMIAGVLGVSRKRVHRLLRDRGILRSRGEAAKLRHAKRCVLENAG